MSMENRSRIRPSKRVTAARAAAQRAKLDALDEERQDQPPEARPASSVRKKPVLPKRRSMTTIDLAILDYLQDHEGGNHSKKTLQWHQTALGLFQQFLAACNWLVSREFIERNPFDRVVFPKVGKPLIRMIEPGEFEQLLLACSPPGEVGGLADRAAARNRAILWVLYDTGIRLSELCSLRLSDVDRTRGIVTIERQGARTRRLALGPQGLRQLLSYLEQHRLKQENLIFWGSAGEEHLFLSETRRALTISGVALLFVRLKRRAGIAGEQVSPQVLRHSFALRYLQAGGSPHRLQEVLGYAGMAQVKQYLRWHDQLVHDHTRDARLSPVE